MNIGITFGDYNELNIELWVIILFIGIYYFFKNYKCMFSDKNKLIKKLLRQSSRWAVAAHQDKSPIISLLHANYAAGYLWSLKDIASDIEIQNATNIDIINFTEKIVDIQDKSTKKVSHACPQFLDDIDKELAKLGGDF
tara:strand:+ start:1711 stop:2127 length:417 start_codon:yes stop_codon:yes gene_type:complete